MSWDFPEYPPNWEEIKKIVLARDGYRCQRCGANNLPLHIHHKRSLSRGGSNNPDNLITLCEYCHHLEHPHLKWSGQIPAHISYEPYKYCDKCKIKFPIEIEDRFCPYCNSFLYTEREEIITPVQIPQKQACFIATVAYGSPLAKELISLRRFRDMFLVSNALGRFFVDVYYKLSPFIARRISASNGIKSIMREILNLVLKLIDRRIIQKQNFK